MKMLLSSSVFFIFSSVVYAGNGKAYVPFTQVNGDQNQFTEISLSNISEKDVTVTITWYDQYNDANKNPVIISDSVSDEFSGRVTCGTAQKNWSENLTSATVRYDIEPYETVLIRLKGTSTWDVGFAVIEWTQDSHNQVALLGQAMLYWSNSEKARAQAVALNNGLPF